MLQDKPLKRLEAVLTWQMGTSERKPSGVTDAHPFLTAHVSDPGVMSLRTIYY